MSSKQDFGAAAFALEAHSAGAIPQTPPAGRAEPELGERRLAGRAGLEFIEYSSEKCTSEETRQQWQAAMCTKLRQIRWELLGIPTRQMFNRMFTRISLFFEQNAALTTRPERSVFVCSLSPLFVETLKLTQGHATFQNVSRDV